MSILFRENGCDSPEKESHLIILGDPKESHLIIDMEGGAFIDFRVAEDGINPFSWRMEQKDMPENNRNGAAFQGHFLCLGRWGAPTAGEMKAGVPHNGEAGNQKWKIITLQNDSLVVLHSEAPLDGIRVERKICFDKSNSLFLVREQIESILSVGRLFNVVQHATLGTPFLSHSTLTDSNVENGFMQHLGYPDPHLYEYCWPEGMIDSMGTKVDLTKSNSPVSYVSTHLLKDDIGWVAVSSPECGILIGYVWKKSDYPWLNIWHEMKEGNPWAKGVEFGTTGIGRSYQELLDTESRFHGVNSFFFLDALEQIEKSFLCFQIRISGNYKGVESIEMEDNRICIQEKGEMDSEGIIIKSALIGEFEKQEKVDGYADDADWADERGFLIYRVQD